MSTETDEERLHRICCSARDTYFNEEQAGKFPNLALIIRDAVLDYASRLLSAHAAQAEAVAWIEQIVRKDTAKYTEYINTRFTPGASSTFLFDGHRWSYKWSSWDDESEYDVIQRPVAPQTQEAPEGCTPADAQMLREANLGLAQESHRRATLLHEWLDTELDIQDEEYQPWLDSFTERVKTELLPTIGAQEDPAAPSQPTLSEMVKGALEAKPLDPDSAKVLNDHYWELIEASNPAPDATPETDAAIVGEFGDTNVPLVTAEFARTLERQRNALRDKLAEVERDAKRYRWLRDTLELAFPRIITKKWWINLGEQSGESFNRTVDAAMKDRHD